MLSFQFEPGSTGSGGFRLGHMTVSRDQRSFSSKGKTPNQAMMIFVSAFELLDGVREFLADLSSTQYVFTGTDSSFEIVFTKESEDRLVISHRDTTIEVPRKELVAALLSGTDDLRARFPLRAEDPVFADLEDAVRAFKEELQSNPAGNHSGSSHQ
jgi:hypothetical protein